MLLPVLSVIMTEHSGEGSVPHWDHLERLAKALKHAGKTKADAAEFLHLSEGTINNYLAGRTHIPYSVMLAWAHFTGVSLNWLTDDDYDPDGDR